MTNQDKELRGQHDANSAQHLAEGVGSVPNPSGEQLVGCQSIGCVEQRAKADDGEDGGARDEGQVMLEICTGKKFIDSKRNVKQTQ
jgi:hypothetical protein